MSAYVDGINDLVLDVSKADTVDSILEEYKSVAGAKINAQKLMGLRLGTGRSRSMPSDGLVGS